MHIYRKKFDYIEIYRKLLCNVESEKKERDGYNSIDLVSEKVQ